MFFTLASKKNLSPLFSNHERPPVAAWAIRLYLKIRLVHLRQIMECWTCANHAFPLLACFPVTGHAMLPQAVTTLLIPHTSETTRSPHFSCARRDSISASASSYVNHLLPARCFSLCWPPSSSSPSSCTGASNFPTKRPHCRPKLWHRHPNLACSDLV